MKSTYTFLFETYKEEEITLRQTFFNLYTVLSCNAGDTYKVIVHLIIVWTQNTINKKSSPFFSGKLSKCCRQEAVALLKQAR